MGAPVSAEALVALLGPEYATTQVTSMTPVRQPSRNRLWRVVLTGGSETHLVLKVVSPSSDRFWDHHLRREHWLLTLLARLWPGRAPNTHAVVIGREWGLLVTEDVGSVSLADVVGQSDALSWIGPVLESVAEMHRVLLDHQASFLRVCRSVQLDSLTVTSLLARVSVAKARLTGAAWPGASLLSPHIRRQYRDQVCRPLLAGRRQVIHNSLSPLNIVLGPEPRVVDWETVAFGAPEFDLADLLRFPGVNMPWSAIDAHVALAFDRQIDPGRLRLAALARCLDYAGSNAAQAERSRREGDVANAAVADSRKTWFLQEARSLGLELCLHDMLAELLPA